MKHKQMYPSVLSQFQAAIENIILAAQCKKQLHYICIWLPAGEERPSCCSNAIA